MFFKKFLKMCKTLFLTLASMYPIKSDLKEMKDVGRPASGTVVAKLAASLMLTVLFRSQPSGLKNRLGTCACRRRIPNRGRNGGERDCG